MVKKEKEFKMKRITRLSPLLIATLFTACGGGGGSTSSSDGDGAAVKTGFFIDAAVKGAEYIDPNGQKDVTDAQGRFKYVAGKKVKFFMGKLVLGEVEPGANGVVTPKLLAEGNTTTERLLLQTLQSLDSDNNTSNGIQIESNLTKALEQELPKERRFHEFDEQELLNLRPIRERADEDDDGHFDVNVTEAEKHYNESIKEFENEHRFDRGGEDENRNEGSENHDGENREGSDDEYGGGGGSIGDDNDNENNEHGGNYNNTGNNNNTGGTQKTYMLTAWNDLGMHCMDGNDFSVFSILPPYNNLHAQLKDKNGGLVTSGVTVTYEAIKGTDGKLNSSSSDKTNFWNYSKKLFGATLATDTGLTGLKTPSTTPQQMSFNPTHQWWEAEGLPITPYNDDGTKNYYPMVKVTAKDSSGKVLASVNTVLPVSDEMDCKRCHATNSLALKAKPNAGWVANADPEKDFKLNILRLHDERVPNAVSDNISALKQKGYDYNTTGLEATVASGTPILCAACHSSNALPGTGVTGVKPFTTAMHGYHAHVIDPYTNLSMDSSKNRSACYACHPGAATKCLRGAMGDATDGAGNNVMQCQSCHGNMSAVGSSKRHGWLDEPNCQACHHDGKRELSAIDPTTNTLRHAVDTRFATNPNTPAQGFSLYRFSTGHGKLQCEACHGATHAIYPAHQADNIASTQIQGHSGTIGECSACHTNVPNTITGGPHGMHPVGQSWVRGHEHVAERNAQQCTVCHGADYRGSNLSKTWTNRSFSTEWGQKNFTKGHKVSCYDCHNGPRGD